MFSAILNCETNGSTKAGPVLNKFGLILIPLIFMIAWSIFGELLISPFENLYIKTIVYVAAGLIGSGILFLIIRFFSSKANIDLFYIGKLKTFVFGCVLGVAVSVICAILFQVSEKKQIDFSKIDTAVAIRFIVNISPAAVEEITFRGGIVNAMTVMSGQSIGLLSGSLPFGAIHLVGKFLGKPVGLWHVLGVTAAGLLLSICYLKFGLLFAIGLHWVWNSMCTTWVVVFGLPKNGGVQMIEGAWTTVIALLIFSTVVYIIPVGRLLTRKT